MAKPEVRSAESVNFAAFELRFFLRASSFVIRHFLCVPALDRNRFSRLIDRDQGKNAMSDAEFFTRHVTRHPNLDGDGHRGPAVFLEVRITPDGVPHSHRLQE